MLYTDRTLTRIFLGGGGEGLVGGCLENWDQIINVGVIGLVSSEDKWVLGGSEGMQPGIIVKFEILKLVQLH